MSSRTRYVLSTGSLRRDIAGDVATGRDVAAGRDMAADLVREAAARDIVMEVKSFIAVEPVAAQGLEELAAKRLVAVFTSVNAVDAVLREQTGPRGWKIYCLNGATSGRVAEAFGEAQIAGEAGSAAALAKLIRDREGEREIYFFCGDKRREELPAILTHAAFRVLEKVVYRTILTPHRVERDYDGIAFFSPTAVESYFSVNAAGSGAVMFAIGQSTGDAIKARCDNPVVTLERAGKDLLIRTMIEHFAKK